MSSAYCCIDKEALPSRMPWMSGAEEIFFARTSVAMTKRSMLKGHPCLIPLQMGIFLVSVWLTFICAKLEERSVEVHWVREDGMPIWRMVASIKEWERESKALWKSS